MPVTNNLQAPVKKPLAWWVKVLIGLGVLVGIGITVYVGFLVLLVFTLGNAGTQYNDVVTKESVRVKDALAIPSCNLSHNDHSEGNLDAIEKYYFEYSCGAVPANLDQQVTGKLSALGYSNYQGLAGIYRNECCEIQYQSTPTGYNIGLYSNQVNGREDLAK